MKTLTAKQAWREIAQAFERSNATGRRNALTPSGLCLAVDIVTGYFDQPYGVPPVPVREEMKAQLRAIHWDHNRAVWDGLTEAGKIFGWWWPTPGDSGFTRASYQERAILAQLLAEMAEDAA